VLPAFAPPSPAWRLEVDRGTVATLFADPSGEPIAFRFGTSRSSPLARHRLAAVAVHFVDELLIHTRSMKQSFLAIALCVLGACASPASEVSTHFLDDSTAVMSFSGHPLSSVTLEELVKSCQEATQFDFTYSEDTQAALQDERFDLPSSRSVPVKEFASILDRSGFMLHGIGPENLHVISIERRPH
jgi:hypothetical protein